MAANGYRPKIKIFRNAMFYIPFDPKFHTGYSQKTAVWSLVSIRLGDIFLILTKYYKNSAQAKRRMSKGRKILNLLLFKSAAIRYIFEKIYKIS